MRRQRIKHLVLIVAAAAFCLMLFAEPALAQCAMCRASFAGNSAFVRNMNLGVLVLLAPPVTIFCAIFVIAYRHRKG
jgi:hypothetical protein